MDKFSHPKLRSLVHLNYYAFKTNFMKNPQNLFLLLLTGLGVSLLIACNDSAQASSSADTTAQATDTTPAQMQMSMPQDSATSSGGLMTAMNNMMDKMHAMQMTGDFDKDFATMLIQHHQSAIDMAQVELSQGSDAKMKSNAQEIITKQTGEQQKLKEFLQDYKPSGMKHGEGELQKGMSVTMDKMKSMQMSSNVDKDFATMMASHHEDGIAMSKLELKNGMSDKLKQMAQKGINDQQKDIKEFEAWLSLNK